MRAFGLDAGGRGLNGAPGVRRRGPMDNRIRREHDRGHTSMSYPAISKLLALFILSAGLCSSGLSEPGEINPPSRETQRGAVRLEGSPEEIGRRHGTLLGKRIRTMVNEYVKDDLASGRLNDTVATRVRAMKPALPGWYRQELAACAKAAGVDEEVLLFAQGEGDIRSLVGCTTYVAFGAAAHDGSMEIGRNFDYWGLKSTNLCAVVLAIVPHKADGYAFVSVGWTGILGGWTLFNEKGLFVANNLGGFGKKNPKGVPTLILARIIAQKAANVDEAIKIIKATPRMRGQALVIGYAGDAASGRKPEAAVVEYDAVTVAVKRHTNGFAFHTSVGTRQEKLLEILRDAKRKPTDAIKSAGVAITLHSVAIRPGEHSLWVAHGRQPDAHLGEYVKYDLQSLLKRQ